MKKKIIVLFIVISLMSACKKSKSPSFQDKLVSHTWYFDSVFMNNVFDSTNTSCNKNCYFIFQSNGKFNPHYENSVCAPGTQPSTFTYIIVHNSGYTIAANYTDSTGYIWSLSYSAEITDSTLNLTRDYGGAIFLYKMKVKK